MNDDFLAQLEKLKDLEMASVIVTLVKIEGSAPQELGARVIVTAEGLYFGTVGGGKIEAKVISYAQEFLALDTSCELKEWNLQKDIGMTCGGVVGLFFEKKLVTAYWKIAVFGAGHVSQELIRLLLRLNCNIVCIDPRSEWLDKLPISPKLKKIQIDDMKSVLKELDQNSFIVSLTMGHAFDLPILTEALGLHNFPYIGAIGSASKALVLKRDLKNNGVIENQIAKLQCPIGENFGTNLPAEIALSVAAQLLKKRDNR
jgi:xanthine dehydrogenase accessory factor